MKKIAFAVSVCFLMSASCKPGDKPVIPEDLMVQILTEGEWTVTDYKLNGVDHTTEFSGWRFKYYSNKTMEAKFNGSVVTTGTWDGSQSTMTFTNMFASTTTAPLPLASGTWHVDTPGTRTVISSQNNGSETRNMKIYRE